MNKGFTLVELLAVLAIATLLIGLAILGSSNTQAQITLSSAASSFVSNINFVKNSAMSGSVELGSDTVSPQTNWVYGFGILSGILNNNLPEGCINSTTLCSKGYYLAILEKNISSSCSDQNIKPYSPPSQNSLLSVISLNQCLINTNSFPIYNISTSPPSSQNNWFYYNRLPLGVTLSVSQNYFPIFQELTGDIYLYNIKTGMLVTSSSSNNTDVIFNLSYEGYTIPITFYDLYYTGNNSNTFLEGHIING